MTGRVRIGRARIGGRWVVVGRGRRLRPTVVQHNITVCFHVNRTAPAGWCCGWGWWHCHILRTPNITNRPSAPSMVSVRTTLQTDHQHHPWCQYTVHYKQTFSTVHGVSTQYITNRPSAPSMVSVCSQSDLI